MKLTKEMERKIIRCSELYSKAIELEREIEDCCFNNGIDIDNDTFRDILIDCVEQTNNSDIFIQMLKDDEFKGV